MRPLSSSASQRNRKRQRAQDLPPGRHGGFWDTYKSEIAAYELRVAALAATPPEPLPPIIVAATPPPMPARAE